MATIKSFTGVTQSKVLAEFLPIESADMYYSKTKILNSDETDYIVKVGTSIVITDVPCWSLAALLSVLPDYTLQTNTDGTVFVVCDSKKPMISDAYDNSVDACVEIIERLHELKML